MKLATNRLTGRAVELLGRRHLLQHAEAHDRYAMAERHRLDLVVGDVEHRHRQGALQAGDLGAHLHAQLGVQVRERLVHEKDLGLAHDGAAHRHPLALAAGELLGLALEQLLELQHAGRFAHAPLDLVFGLVVQAQPEGHVLVDAQVRVEGVVLKDHGDVAIARLEVVDDLAVDHDVARIELLKAGQHAQGGRLAAARGSDQHHELAVGDAQVEVVDDLVRRRSSC